MLECIAERRKNIERHYKAFNFNWLLFNEDIHKLYDRNRIRNNYLKIDNHTSREKISILFDGMWKAMIYNTNRLKYSCKLLSYYLNIPYEELLKSLSLGKNELDKRNINNKG